MNGTGVCTSSRLLFSPFICTVLLVPSRYSAFVQRRNLTKQALLIPRQDGRGRPGSNTLCLELYTVHWLPYTSLAPRRHLQGLPSPVYDNARVQHARGWDSTSSRASDVHAPIRQTTSLSSIRARVYLNSSPTHDARLHHEWRSRQTRQNASAATARLPRRATDAYFHVPGPGAGTRSISRRGWGGR